MKGHLAGAPRPTRSCRHDMYAFRTELKEVAVEVIVIGLTG